MNDSDDKLAKNIVNQVFSIKDNMPVNVSAVSIPVSNDIVKAPTNNNITQTPIYTTNNSITQTRYVVSETESEPSRQNSTISFNEPLLKQVTQTNQDNDDSFVGLMKFNLMHLFSVFKSNFLNMITGLIIVLFVFSLIVLPVTYMVYKVEGFDFPSDSLSFPPRKQGPVQACTKFGMRRPDLVRAGKWCGKSVEDISEVDSMLNNELAVEDTTYVYDVADSNSNILDILPEPPLVTDPNVAVKVDSNDGSIDIESSIENIGSLQSEKQIEQSAMTVNESFKGIVSGTSYPSNNGIGRINKEHLNVGLDRTLYNNQSRFDPVLLDPSSIIYTPSDELESFKPPTNKSIANSRRNKRK